MKKILGIMGVILAIALTGCKEKVSPIDNTEGNTTPTGYCAELERVLDSTFVYFNTNRRGIPELFTLMDAKVTDIQTQKASNTFTISGMTEEGNCLKTVFHKNLTKDGTTATEELYLDEKKVFEINMAVKSEGKDSIGKMETNLSYCEDTSYNMYIATIDSNTTEPFSSEKKFFVRVELFGEIVEGSLSASEQNPEVIQKLIEIIQSHAGGKVSRITLPLTETLLNSDPLLRDEIKMIRELNSTQKICPQWADELDALGTVACGLAFRYWAVLYGRISCWINDY